MSDSEERRRFEHKTLGFSLVPPEGWKCVEAPEGATFTAPSSSSGGEGDENAPGLAVNVQNLTGTQRTLGGFTASALEELAVLQNGQSTGQSDSQPQVRPALMAGRRAYTVRYTLTGATIEQTWTVLTTPPVALVATATVPPGTSDAARRTALRAMRTAVGTIAVAHIRCVPENLLGALVLAPARDFPAALAPMRLAVPPLWKREIVPGTTSTTAAVSYSVRTPLDAGAGDTLFRVTASATRVMRGTTLDAWVRAGVARLRASGAQDMLVVGACAADIGRPACVLLGACPAVTVRYTLPRSHRAGVVVWALRESPVPRVHALSFVLEPPTDAASASSIDDERPFAVFSRIVEHCELPLGDDDDNRKTTAQVLPPISEQWHVYEDIEAGMTMRFPACLVPTPHADGCTVAFGPPGAAQAQSQMSVAVLFQRVASAPAIADVCASLRASVVQDSAERVTVLEERATGPDTAVVAYRLGDAQADVRRLVQYVRVADGVVVLATVACPEEHFLRMWLALRIDMLIHSIRKLED